MMGKVFNFLLHSLGLFIHKGSFILVTNQTYAQQFHLFYNTHKPQNLEDALEKFAIFGGVEWGKIDTTKNTFELIESLILQDYNYIRNDITDLTDGVPLYHSILSAIALGDGKEHAVFKRANISEQVGRNSIEVLLEKKIIKAAKAKKGDVRFYFATPFLRFWFGFVSPLFKGVRDGDFREVKERWENKKGELFSEAFSRLSRELVKRRWQDKRVMKTSSFIYDTIFFDIYLTTKEKQTIIGTTKYSDSKVKKTTLTKLQQQAKEAQLSPDGYIIVAKKGFSSELKSLKGDNLTLLTLKHFKELTI